MRHYAFSAARARFVVLLAFAVGAVAGTSAGCSSKGPNGDGAGGAVAGGAGGTGGGAADAYLQGCETLFAARILEKQIEADPAFPEDCNVELSSDIGTLSSANNPICVAGETANGCRNRLYDTPPRLYQANNPQLAPEVSPGCADPPAEGCLLGKWLPKCADGTDGGCAQPEVVCRDGTRPMVYMEAATAVALSNSWIIYMGGEGGPCSGAKCWFDYKYGLLMGESPFSQAMSSIHPDLNTQPGVSSYAGTSVDGIMAGAATAANPFASFNRVKFERCGDAASDGLEVVPFGNGIPKSIADKGPQPPPIAVETRVSHTEVPHRGFATWTALFNSLATEAGRDRDGDGTPDVPSFADATQVLLVGASDASVWLTYAADRLAAEVRAVAGASVDVRIMIDGFFEPALDSAGRYHAAAPANFNLFDNPYHVTGLCTLPDNGDGVANETCSDLSYEPGPAGEEVTFRDEVDARGMVLDESCELAHGAHSPVCYDKLHTLLNHVATPFLVMASDQDQTISGAPPYYADAYSYEWPSDHVEYRARVLDQVRDVAALWDTAAREEGAGTPGDAVLIVPRSTQHVRFGDNAELLREMSLCSAAGAKLGGASLGAAIAAWSDGTLPAYFVFEDGPGWDGTSPYWVTGSNCSGPPQ
ncbi:MAG: hypothetical protein HY908_08905 [Myxococcales bacterium]|nr:hypothetical protein [Myxococcales bacterium]